MAKAKQEIKTDAPAVPDIVKLHDEYKALAGRLESAAKEQPKLLAKIAAEIKERYKAESKAFDDLREAKRAAGIAYNEAGGDAAYSAATAK